MSYGQSIPKKIVWDTQARILTKAAYCHQLAKALQSAGMVFLPAISSYDFLDERFAEGEHEFAGLTAITAWFDFPTTETFTVNEVQYRPMLGLRYAADSANPGALGNSGAETVLCELAVRRADRVVPTDFITYYSFRFSTSFFGMGGSTETSATPLAGAVSAIFAGAWLVADRPEWSSHYVTNGHRAQPVGNIFVCLGPGGLVVCTGRDRSQSGFATVQGFAVVFYGSRIPGRAYPPMTDANLSRCNPAVMIPFNSVDGEFIGSGTTAHLLGHVMGCQYDLQATQEPVHWYHYNMENVDRPLFPDLFVTVRNSPREISGAGRHVLVPMIGIPNQRRTTSTELYSKVIQEISTTRVSPPWEDFFYAPNARLADATAPVGEYEDPVSNINWWLVPMANTGQRLAVNVEGATQLLALPSTIPTTLQSTENYDGTASGDSSVFPRTTLFVRNQTGGGLAGQNFLWVGGSNILRATWNATTANSQRRTRIHISMLPYTFDPRFLFVLKYELTVRSTMVGAPITTANTPYFVILVNNPYGSQHAAGVTVLAGRSAGENGYSSRTMEHFIVPNYGNADPTNTLLDNITISLQAFDHTTTSPGGTHTIEVSNIRIETRLH